jgi:hypothetical protein
MFGMTLRKTLRKEDRMDRQALKTFYANRGMWSSRNLLLLRYAFEHDVLLSRGSLEAQQTKAFCQTRIDIIDEVLREREAHDTER